ncbi:MAG TPA: hypothetical protein VK864_07355 [Longimicrobiales bacterium]|nr:hypothetical protein [Longimicrobiales bacterium]
MRFPFFKRRPDGDAELIVAFLDAIADLPSREAAAEFNIDARIIAKWRNGKYSRLRPNVRESLSSFLLRRSVPEPPSSDRPAPLVWEARQPAILNAPARLGDVAGFGVAEIAARTDAELVVVGEFLCAPDARNQVLPRVASFHGYLVDGQRSAEIDVPVRIEALGDRTLSDAPVYFGGRIRI